MQHQEQVNHFDIQDSLEKGNLTGDTKFL